MKTTTKNDAYIRLHTAILLAGGTGLFGRLISIGELPLVFIRVLLAALILGAFMSAKNQLRMLAWKDLWKIMGCGVLLSIHWVFYYGSIKAANVSIGAVCFALVGFFTAILEPILTHRKFSWRELSLSLLALMGIGLIFGLDARYRLGIGIGTASSFVYTFFSIFSKKVQAQTCQRSSTMLLFELTGGALALLLLTPLYQKFFPHVAIVPTWSDGGYLLLFASIFTVIPFLLQLQALRTISAFTVNLSYNLEPVYSILLAMIIFDEANELNPSFWMGILLILFSVILQTVGSMNSQRNNSLLH